MNDWHTLLAVLIAAEIVSRMVLMKTTPFLNVLFFHSLSVCSTELPPLYTLHADLFSNYQRDIRPVKNYSKVVMVQVGFMLSTLESLDAVKQTFKAAGWFSITWVDEMLTWERSQYPGLQRIDFPADKVWKPDMSIRNDAREFVKLSKHGGHCIVKPDGEITWYLALRLETNCAINIKKFPFDTQTCSINLIQWATNISEVNFTVTSAEVAPLLFTNLYEWQVIGHSVDRSSVPYQDMEQVYFRFQYYLKRKPFSFIVSGMLPLMLLSLLNLAVFHLPAETGEKMSLSVSVVLAYSVHMTILSTLLPNTSDSVSIFGIYTLSMIFIKVVTIILSVIVVRLYHADPRLPISPRWKQILATFRIVLEHPDRVVSSHNQEVNLKQSEHPKYSVWKQLSRKLDTVFLCVISAATLGGTVVCFALLLT